MRRRGRSLSVLLLVIAGGLGMLSSTQPWLVVEIASAAEPLPVPGAEALPVLTPLSLAMLALAGVLALVARPLRYVLAAFAAAGGLWLFLATLPLLGTPPLSAVAATVTEHTGLAGSEAVASLVTAVRATAWPAAALVLWALLLLAAVFIAVSAHRWAASGRRYRTEAVPQTGPVDAIDSWDELSRGTDPTGEDR